MKPRLWFGALSIGACGIVLGSSLQTLVAKPRYFWYGPAVVESLRVQLNESGPAELRVRADNDKPPHMWMQVVPLGDSLHKSSHVLPVELEESTWCPPLCGTLKQ